MPSASRICARSRSASPRDSKLDGGGRAARPARGEDAPIGGLLMRQKIPGLAALLLVGGLMACEDTLSVDNPNQPERDRVLSTPADVEQFIANSYVTMHQGTLCQGVVVAGGQTNDALQPQLLTMGMENMSPNANYGMALRSGVPRVFIDNSRGNQTELGQLRDWRFLHRSARMAAIG